MNRTRQEPEPHGLLCIQSIPGPTAASDTGRTPHEVAVPLVMRPVCHTRGISPPQIRREETRVTESHENNAEDEIVVDLGLATAPDEGTAVITDARVAEAIRNARNEVAEEYVAEVNSAQRDIRIRVHSW